MQVYLNDDLEKSIQALSEDMKACETGYQDLYYGSSGSMGSSKATLNLDDHAFGRVQVNARCNCFQYRIMGYHLCFEKYLLSFKLLKVYMCGCLFEVFLYGL